MCALARRENDHLRHIYTYCRIEYEIKPCESLSCSKRNPPKMGEAAELEPSITIVFNTVLDER